MRFGKTVSDGDNKKSYFSGLIKKKQIIRLELMK